MTSESKALAKRPEGIGDILLDQGRALKELRARWPKDLVQEDAARQFLALCLTYNLDPFLGEMVPYQGRPYIEEQGWLKLIGQYAKGELVLFESRQATQQEREEIGIGGGDFLAIAVVVRRFFDDRELKVTRRGLVRKGETAGSEFLPIVKEPWEMAEKRARVRALRTAFRDVLQAAIPMFAEGEREAAIEGEARVVSDEPLRSEQVVEANLKDAVEKARGEFYKAAEGLGLVDHKVIHEKLGLTCTSAIHNGEGPNACHALRDEMKRLAKTNESLPAAWEHMTMKLKAVMAGSEPEAQPALPVKRYIGGSQQEEML